MNNEQKLIIAKNLIRTIFYEMDEDITNRFAENHDFFNRVVNDGKKINVIRERSPGIFELTSMEKYNSPRHKGKRRIPT